MTPPTVEQRDGREGPARSALKTPPLETAGASGSDGSGAPAFFTRRPRGTRRGSTVHACFGRSRGRPFLPVQGAAESRRSERLVELGETERSVAWSTTPATPTASKRHRVKSVSTEGARQGALFFAVRS